MDWEDDHELVASLARSAVARTAADELPFFELTAAGFLAGSERARRTARKDEPLGFGGDAALVLISTAALTVTVDVLKQLSQYYSERLVQGAARRTRGWFRRRSTAAAAPAGVPLPRLSADQIAELRELAYRRAKDAQVPDASAALIADAIVGGIVTRSEAHDEQQ
ncbi:hypothetical protein [Kitasatospora sp. NPDC056181]|uniref:hypothetical protein n=1 Tax=Kitasatospora sp. NPDC056181 TaxID=3345737 RepID=UPI0035E055F4